MSLAWACEWSSDHGSLSLSLALLYSTSSSLLRVNDPSDITLEKCTYPLHNFVGNFRDTQQPHRLSYFGWELLTQQQITAPFINSYIPFLLYGPLCCGIHISPVICINSGTIEESCEDTSISTNSVQGQRDPVHRGEQEDRKGKYKCLMIWFSDTAIYPQNSIGRKKANTF